MPKEDYDLYVEDNYRRSSHSQEEVGVIRYHCTCLVLIYNVERALTAPGGFGGDDDLQS